MFLRIIRSLDKTINLTGTKFYRFISQTSLNPISSATRPLKFSNNKPISLSTDITSSMKLSVSKRISRKKPLWKSTNIQNQREEQYFNVCAYATADWYDLDQLKQRFSSSLNSFQLIPFSEMFSNVLCIKISKQTTTTNSEAFVFDDGVVVFWNVEQDNEKLILNQVNEISDNQYPKDLINNEKEIMNFIEVTTPSTLNNDIIKLNCQSETEQLLDKYTFSNALALSVKLGIWEALLDDEIEFIADLANRLKQGKHIKIEHGLMQRKSGELYSLKHAVNLSHGI
jgi:uncharacterized Rmd1/YagE family protein